MRDGDAGSRCRHKEVPFRCANDERDEAVHHQEHRHGERAVPGAHPVRARGRPRGGQRGQQLPLQHEHPLARRAAAAERVVRRAGLHHAVPDPARPELRLQVPDLRPARHAVVARARLLAALHRARPHRHPAPRRRALPVPNARPRAPRHLRRVVAERHRGGHRAGALHRRRAQRVRRLHHQRPPRPALHQLLRGGRHVPAQGDARQDLHAPAHQRRAQRRALLRRRQPHAHRRRRRRALRQALRRRQPPHRARADQQRAPHGQAHVPRREVLHAGPAIHHHAPGHLRQHHRRRRPRVRRPHHRRQQDDPAAHLRADAPADQRHQRGLQLHREAAQPGQRRVPGVRAAGRGPGVLLHRRPRHPPLRRRRPRQRDHLPGPQRDGPVRGLHQQRLLRAPDHGAPAVALHRHVRRRLRNRLPLRPGGPVQLHRHAAQQHQRHERDQGPGAAVRRRRGARDAGHQHHRRREPPAAPARIQLLRRRPRVRELRPGQRPGQLQPRRPRRAQHRRRPRRRLGRHPLPRRQPRCMVHALPLGGAHELGTEDGVAGAGRQPSGPEAPAAAGRSPQMLAVKIKIDRENSRSTFVLTYPASSS